MSAFNNKFRLNQENSNKGSEFLFIDEWNLPSIQITYPISKLILFYMSKYKRVAINDFNLQSEI